MSSFSYTSTAFPMGQSSMFRGNVGVVGGHYNFGGGISTAQTIATGGSHVMMAFSQSSSTKLGLSSTYASVQPCGIAMNENAAGSKSYGSVKLVPSYGTDDGHWFAIVAVAGTIDPSES